MHLIARFKRWCHCLWFLLRPWTWEEGKPLCRAVTAWEEDELALLGCDCGKVFWPDRGADLRVKATEDDWSCDSGHWKRSDGLQFHREFCAVWLRFPDGQCVKIHPANKLPTSWKAAMQWVDDHYLLGTKSPYENPAGMVYGM